MCSVSLNPLVINNAWKQFQGQLSLEGVGSAGCNTPRREAYKAGLQSLPSSVDPNTQVVPLSRTL